MNCLSQVFFGIKDLMIGMYSFLVPVFKSVNWLSVTEEIIGGAVVATAFGIIFPWWFKKSLRPKSLLIEIDPAYENEFVTRGKKTFFKILLMMSNDRRVPIKEKIFWKILVPEDVNIDSISKGVTRDIQKPFVVLGGTIDGPLFPNRALAALNISGSFENDRVEKLKFLYEISTEFGLYPKKMRKFYRKNNGFSFSEKNLKAFGIIALNEKSVN